MGRLADITKHVLKDLTGAEIEPTELFDEGSDGLVYKGRFSKNKSDSKLSNLAIKFYIPSNKLSFSTDRLLTPV